MTGCHIKNGSHFLRGKDILTLSAHYLSYTQLYGDIWLHSDTLYPSISPFPPLVLRSLKVTSVWLPLQTGPMHFIAELYIWTPLVSLTNPPPLARPPLLHARLILGLSPRPPPDTFQTPISSLSNRISPYWPVETLGYRFNFIQIKYCTKHHTNQMSITSGPHVWGCTGEKAYTQAHSFSNHNESIYVMLSMNKHIMMGYN